MAISTSSPALSAVLRTIVRENSRTMQAVSLSLAGGMGPARTACMTIMPWAAPYETTTMLSPRTQKSSANRVVIGLDPLAAMMEIQMADEQLTVVQAVG